MQLQRDTSPTGFTPKKKIDLNLPKEKLWNSLRAQLQLSSSSTPPSTSFISKQDGSDHKEWKTQGSSQSLETH